MTGWVFPVRLLHSLPFAGFERRTMRRRTTRSSTGFSPHLTRTCQGLVLHSIGQVKELMEGARTATGLEVTVDILDRVYQGALKSASDFKLVFYSNTVTSFVAKTYVNFLD